MESQASMAIHTSTPTAVARFLARYHRTSGTRTGIIRFTTVATIPTQPEDAGTTAAITK